MNEEFQDAGGTVHVAQRSPTFNRDEAEALIRLVEEYKSVILNKSTNSITNHAKEIVWNKVAKSFNSKGFRNKRTPENLKTKWENLKRNAKKLSKNMLRCDLNEKEFLNQVIALLNESENFGPVDSNEVAPIGNDVEYMRKLWEDNDDGDDDEISAHSQTDGRNLSRGRFKVHRSLNFSPQECNLLLKCIKSEKDHIFLKDLTGRSTKLKRNAWAKVTYIFNKLSPQKRSMKTLRTKFDNMRKQAQMMNRGHMKHQRLHDDTDVKIKKEPTFECSFEKEDSPEASEDEHNIDEEQRVDDYHDQDIELGSPDPLTTILNGDSGIESINNFGNTSHSDDKKMNRIKMEILKNQLETSKMERQRVAEKIESDRKDQESRALEMSLRLRTARLELAAAEARLPPAHPALQYYNEAKASEYMQQFSNT